MFSWHFEVVVAFSIKDFVALIDIVAGMAEFVVLVDYNIIFFNTLAVCDVAFLFAQSALALCTYGSRVGC